MDIKKFLTIAEQERILLTLLANGDLTVGDFSFTQCANQTLRTKVKNAFEDGYTLTKSVAAVMLLLLRNEQHGMDYFYSAIRNFDMEAVNMLIETYGEEHILNICFGREKIWNQIMWVSNTNFLLAYAVNHARTVEFLTDNCTQTDISTVKAEYAMLFSHDI